MKMIKKSCLFFVVLISLMLFLNHDYSLASEYQLETNTFVSDEVECSESPYILELTTIYNTPHYDNNGDYLHPFRTVDKFYINTGDVFIEESSPSGSWETIGEDSNDKLIFKVESISENGITYKTNYDVFLGYDSHSLSYDESLIVLSSNMFNGLPSDCLKFYKVRILRLK